MVHRPRVMCGIGLGLLMMTGCQQSSHFSHQTYEYSDQGRAENAPPPAPTAEQSRPSDYQMTSPGEMRSPGDMTSPGRPVVEPRRNP